MSEQPQTAPLELLERRYRRLLALYPPAWRHARLEEVLGVLLECAEPERRRPGVRDAANLIGHALAERIRLSSRMPVSSDERRRGAALAGIVAFGLLAAISVLQLAVLVPDPQAWAWLNGRIFQSVPFGAYGSPAPLLAIIASTACLLAGGMWLARCRRLAIAAMGLADVAFVLAALALRNGLFVAPWKLLAVILGLAVLATALVAHAGVGDAARRRIGPRGAIELVGAFVLIALFERWRYIGWGSSVYGESRSGPDFYAIPYALSVAFVIVAVLALAVSLRNPVPLIAVTALSPLLLAWALVPLAQALVFGNAEAEVGVGVESLAASLGTIAFLAGATLMALWRSRAPA